MWEAISFAAGMLVLMLLGAILPYVFELPDAVVKYLRGRSRKAEVMPTSDDPDGQAARLLGEGLTRGRLAPKAVAQVMQAFWAASPQDRRALAHLVAGMTANGRVKSEVLLTAVRSLPAASGSCAEQQQGPLAAADGESDQIVAADGPRE